MIKNENIDYDQVALRFASPVPPRPKCSVTIAALKQKFSLLPAAAQSLDENGDGFLTEGEVAKIMAKSGIIMQLADIRALLDAAEKDEDGRISVESFARTAQTSEALAAKAIASTRLETMGLIALSKMLDPVHMLSTILPALEKADSSATGSVSKAEFNRVIRANIAALTAADCEKVLKASGCDGPTVSLSLFKSCWTPPLPPPTPCAKEALSILGLAISSNGGLRSAFEQFDKNKDGILERGEFRRGLFLLKAGLTAAHIAELMQLMDSDGNGKIDLSEFEAAFIETQPQHVRASVDQPRLPLLPQLRDEPYADDGNGGGSSRRRSVRHVVAEMAVQVCMVPEEDPVTAFSRRVTEIFRQSEERVLRGLEATDTQGTGCISAAALMEVLKACGEMGQVSPDHAIQWLQQHLPDSIPPSPLNLSEHSSPAILYPILLRRFASSRLLAASPSLSQLQDNDVALFLLPHNAAILAACETADADGSGMISGAVLAGVLAGPPLFLSPVNVTFLLARIGATRFTESIAYDKFIHAFAIGGRAGIDVADSAKKRLLAHIMKEKVTPLQLMQSHGLLPPQSDSAVTSPVVSGHVPTPTTSEAKTVTSEVESVSSENLEDRAAGSAAEPQSNEPHLPPISAAFTACAAATAPAAHVFDRASVRQFLRKVGAGSLNGSDVHALVHTLDPGLTDHISQADLISLMTDKETEAAAKKLQEEQAAALLQRQRDEAEAFRKREEEVLQQRRLQLEQALAAEAELKLQQQAARDEERALAIARAEQLQRIEAQLARDRQLSALEKLSGKYAPLFSLFEKADPQHVGFISHRALSIALADAEVGLPPSTVATLLQIFCNDFSGSDVSPDSVEYDAILVQHTFPQASDIAAECRSIMADHLDALLAHLQQPQHHQQHSSLSSCTVPAVERVICDMSLPLNVSQRWALVRRLALLGGASPSVLGVRNSMGSASPAVTFDAEKAIWTIAQPLLQAAVRSSSQDVGRAFAVLDTNGDGVLTSQELHRGLVALGVGVGAALLQLFLKHIDRDGDGKVSVEEFMRAHAGPEMIVRSIFLQHWLSILAAAEGRSRINHSTLAQACSVISSVQATCLRDLLPPLEEGVEVMSLLREYAPHVARLVEILRLHWPDVVSTCRRCDTSGLGWVTRKQLAAALVLPPVDLLPDEAAALVAVIPSPSSAGASDAPATLVLGSVDYVALMKIVSPEEHALTELLASKWPALYISCSEIDTISASCVSIAAFEVAAASVSLPVQCIVSAAHSSAGISNGVINYMTFISRYAPAAAAALRSLVDRASWKDFLSLALHSFPSAADPHVFSPLASADAAGIAPMSVRTSVLNATLQHPLLRLQSEQIDCICQWLDRSFTKDDSVAWGSFVWVLAAPAATSALQRVWRQLWEASASRSGDHSTWTPHEIISLLQSVKLPPHEAAAVLLHVRASHSSGDSCIDWLAAMSSLAGSE